MASKEQYKRISARQAGNIALKYLTEMKGGAVVSFSIEEIELTGNDKYWRVVCSYLENYFASTKSLKELKIDAQTQEVISMKMRK